MVPGQVGKNARNDVCVRGDHNIRSYEVWTQSSHAGGTLMEQRGEKTGRGGQPESGMEGRGGSSVQEKDPGWGAAQTVLLP